MKSAFSQLALLVFFKKDSASLPDVEVLSEAILQEPSTSGTDVGDNFDIGAVRIENATGRLIPEQVSKDLLSSVQLRSQCLERHGSLQTVQGKLNRALQVPSRYIHAQYIM